MNWKIIYQIIFFIALVYLGYDWRRRDARHGKAQTLSRLSRFKIGILQSHDHPSSQAVRDGFVQGFKDFGFREGINLTLDEDKAYGSPSDLADAAGSMIDHNDVVLAIGTPASLALQAVQSETPVFFAAVSNPKGAGLVEDLDKPKGLMTGTSDGNLLADQVSLVAQYPSPIQRVGVLYSGDEANACWLAAQAQSLLEGQGVQVQSQAVQSDEEIAPAFQNLVDQGAQALFIPEDNRLASQAEVLAGLADASGLPIFGGSKAQCESYGLATVTVDYYTLGQQTAEMLFSVIRGRRLEDTRVQFSQVKRLVVSEKRARTLGIDPEVFAYEAKSTRRFGRRHH